MSSLESLFWLYVGPVLYLIKSQGAPFNFKNIPGRETNIEGAREPLTRTMHWRGGGDALLLSLMGQ